MDAPENFYHRFMYIAPSCGLSLLNLIVPFNPNRPGGGGGGGGIRPPPPSTFHAIYPQREKLAATFQDFFFQVSRNFWDQICRARAYRF